MKQALGNFGNKTRLAIVIMFTIFIIITFINALINTKAVIIVSQWDNLIMSLHVMIRTGDETVSGWWNEK